MVNVALVLHVGVLETVYVIISPLVAKYVSGALIGLPLTLKEAVPSPVKEA
jgi:hypothetical protein